MLNPSKELKDHINKSTRYVYSVNTQYLFIMLDYNYMCHTCINAKYNVHVMIALMYIVQVQQEDYSS